MNRIETFCVFLLIITITVIAVPVTKYMYEPIEENHLTPEPYGEIFYRDGLYKSQVGTQTWKKVYNRAGTFNEKYEWNDFTYFANGTDAARVIQEAIYSLPDGGKLHLESGNYYFSGPLNINNTIVLEDNTIIQGYFADFS